MKNERPKPSWSKTIDDGFRDPATCPMDAVLKLALSDDRQEFQWAISLLRSMYNCGRAEAGVFLLGLLRTCGDNWEKRMAIATSFFDMQTEPHISALFEELRRVKNINSTRRYLRELIGVLSAMPPSLVLSGFQELAEDKSLTVRIRIHSHAEETQVNDDQTLAPRRKCHVERKAKSEVPSWRPCSCQTRDRRRVATESARKAKVTGHVGME